MTFISQTRAVVDQAELYATRRRVIQVRFAEGALDLVAHRDTSACALRVIADGKLGASFAEAPSKRLLDDARETAAFGQPAQFSFAPEQTYEAPPPFDPATGELTAGDLIDVAVDVRDRIARAAPDAVVSLVCEAESGRRSVETTGGAAADEPFSRVTLGVRVPFASGGTGVGATARRFSPGPAVVADAWLDGLLERRDWGQAASVPESGRWPVLLMPYASSLLTLTLATCLSSDSVAKGASPLAAKLGERILSERLTIREDPAHQESPYARSFDDEGVAVRPRTIIDRGTLTGFLTDLRGAAELGQAPTGNAARRTMFSEKIEDAPTPGWLGAIIEPGEPSWRTLLGEIEEGILVTRMSGLHSSNLLQGQYAVHVDGFHVRGGKPIGYLERTMLAGNVFEDFVTLRGISCECEPTARKEMEVAGLAPYMLLDSAQVTVG
jgi:PmbA protein